AHVDIGDREMAREVHRLARLGVRLEEVGNGGVVVVDGARSSLVDEVLAKQDLDSSLLELKALVKKGKVEVFSQGGDGALRYQGRLCVPCVDGLRENHSGDVAHDLFLCIRLFLVSYVLTMRVSPVVCLGPR
ncbi:hypothetical protein MTR67_018560, partial [Solanum verrucosum]